MVLEKIFRPRAEEEKTGEPESDWLELDTSAFKDKTSVDVRVEILKDFADINRVQAMLREGTIVFLKIKDLRQKDLTELKHAVDKLKKTCIAMDGDIIGVDEDFLVLTPNYAKIWRGH